MKYGERKGDWIQTFTGRQFWPLDPRPEEIFIEDIAHALALQCRYGGHSEYHYSVAQHSWYVSQVVPKEFALAGLLHDAAEAYLVDVPRPVKRHLHDYMVIEGRLQVAVGQRFGIDWNLFECSDVKMADMAVGLVEKATVMKPAPVEWLHDGRSEGARPAQLTINYWNPWAVEHAFLGRFRELTA